MLLLLAVRVVAALLNLPDIKTQAEDKTIPSQSASTGTGYQKSCCSLRNACPAVTDPPQHMSTHQLYVLSIWFQMYRSPKYA